MRSDQFLRYYPQFTDFPPRIVLRKAIRQANARFEDFGEDREEARRLYVAHKLTLYAYTFPAAGGDSSSITAASLSAAGKASSAQQATSKKVGEVSVSYSSGLSSSNAVDTGFADLKETAFGLQLLTLTRLHIRPRYIP